MNSLTIKTGDQVKVMRGRDAGKQGKVTQVFPDVNKVVVEGVNSMTKNIRGRRRNEKGQRVQFFAPINRSNVMLIDDAGQPTRRRQSLANKVQNQPAVTPQTK